MHPRCEAILKLRAKMKLTQRALAAELGTTVTQVSRWEHGTIPGEAWWRLIRQKWPEVRPDAA